MSYQFGGSQLQQQNVPNAKYKTMLCRHYQATKQCAIGNKCQFAHGTQEQRQINDPLPASALSAMATVIEQPQNKPQPPIFQSIAQIINILFLANTMPKIIVKMAKIVNIFTVFLIFILDSDTIQQQPIPFTQQSQLPSPPPQVKQEDPMQLVFQHISFEMQYIFPQDDIIQKLKIAQEQARVGNLIAVAECIKSIIHAPERTQEEILKYTNLYNQAVTYFNQISQAN